MDMNEAISMFEPFFVGLIVLLAAGLPHRRRAGRNTVRQKDEGAQAKASAGLVKDGDTAEVI